jgi:hypothetical protein
VKLKLDEDLTDRIVASLVGRAPVRVRRAATTAQGVPA